MGAQSELGRVIPGGDSGELTQEGPSKVDRQDILRLFALIGFTLLTSACGDGDGDEEDCYEQPELPDQTQRFFPSLGEIGPTVANNKGIKPCGI